MARLNYARELSASATWPLAAALAEGSFASVVAHKYFQASPGLVAVIVAAPMFGNIVALFWARLAERRRKVPFLNALQAGIVLCVGLVAATWFLPIEIGAYVFALLVLLARVFASGVVTARNIIWRMNYPAAHLGRIVGKITMVSSIVLAIATLAGSSVLDRYPQAYAIVYLVGAVLGVVGIIQFSRIRVRGEWSILHETPAAWSKQTNSWQDAVLSRVLRDCWTLLRDDPQFRRYQRWQMVQGASFMTMIPALYEMVSRDLTDPNRDYAIAVSILHVVPNVVMMLAISPWARWFDRIDFAHFRLYQSYSALLTHATICIGALLGNLYVVGAGTTMLGISMAGGNLAWNLGQNSFSSREQLGRYMGVHVMLTGIRGLLFPFVGTFLYGLSSVNTLVFILTTCMCGAATLGYLRMARDRTIADRRKLPPLSDERNAADVLRRS